MKNSVHELKPSDFPDGVPALKWKRGLFYRANNSGYTDHFMDAGLYTKEDVLSDCFSGETNGKHDVYGMTLDMALRQKCFSREKWIRYQGRLNEIFPYITVEDYNTMIF